MSYYENKIRVISKNGNHIRLEITANDNGVKLVSEVDAEIEKQDEEYYSIKSFSMERPKIFLDMKTIKKDFEMSLDSWLLSDKCDLSEYERVQESGFSIYEPR